MELLLQLISAFLWVFCTFSSTKFCILYQNIFIGDLWTSQKIKVGWNRATLKASVTSEVKSLYTQTIWVWKIVWTLFNLFKHWVQFNNNLLNLCSTEEIRKYTTIWHISANSYITISHWFNIVYWSNHGSLILLLSHKLWLTYHIELCLVPQPRWNNLLWLGASVMSLLIFF